MCTIPRRATAIILALALSALTAACQNASPLEGPYPVVDQENDWSWIDERTHG